MNNVKQERVGFENSGEIFEIRNHGSIFNVILKTESGKERHVYFDARCFANLCEGEGVNDPQELLGREASYDGEVFNFV